MTDFSMLCSEHDRVDRWRAEVESANANLQIARINERCASLISLHEPLASLGLDRERVRLILSYVRHGDLVRFYREFSDLRTANSRKGVTP